MNRRKFLTHSAALGVAAGPLAKFARSGEPGARNKSGADSNGEVLNPLTPPSRGSIPVAFLISEGAVMIDFAGPWEVFQDVNIAGRPDPPFSLYTVADSAQPIHASGGMKITPDYTIDNAPAPKVIVIPAQSPATDRTKEWIRSATKTTDVTMSVCTGAFVLASTGLLSGKAVTTHHGAYVDLQKSFPDIRVKRGARFVEAGNLASAGGLSSGIDLALRVVERYYGREVARQTAFTMEYQGEGWLNPESNLRYARPYAQNREHPVCPVCGMDADRSIRSLYKGNTYYFCSPAHKNTFDDSPDQFTKL